MSAPLAWRARRESKAQVKSRKALREAIQLAQRLERTARPRKLRSMDRAAKLETVTWAHLVRGIEVAQGINDLRSNPVDLVLLRSLFEAFVNAAFIISQPSRAAHRAARFFDYMEVDKLRVLVEIAARFPGVVPNGRTLVSLRRRLKHFNRRFPTTSWERRDFVSRIEAIGKSKRFTDPHKHKRSIVVYRETNPAVHSNMFAMIQSMTRGGGGESFRPGRSQEQRLPVALMAASILIDLAGVVTVAAEIDAYDTELKALSDRLLRLSDRLAASPKRRRRKNS